MRLPSKREQVMSVATHVHGRLKSNLGFVRVHMRSDIVLACVSIQSKLARSRALESRYGPQGSLSPEGGPYG